MPRPQAGAFSYSLLVKVSRKREWTFAMSFYRQLLVTEITTNTAKVLRICNICFLYPYKYNLRYEADYIPW